MATKRECDRCKQQWNAGTGTDKQTAQISFSIPHSKSIPPSINNREWTERPTIIEQLDCCQDCSRAIYEFATTGALVNEGGENES